MKSSTPGPKTLLSTSEVAAQLGTTLRHVRELRARRELPAILIGRLVRYDPSDLGAYLDANRQPALRGPLANGVGR